MILGQLASLELPIIGERRENDSPIITATFVTAWGFKLAAGIRVFATELPRAYYIVRPDILHVQLSSMRL